MGTPSPPPPPPGLPRSVSQSSERGAGSPMMMTSLAQNRQNVQVYCRFRPPLDIEQEDVKRYGVICDIDPKANTVTVKRHASPEDSQEALFTFDCAFGPREPQEAVFNRIAQPMLAEIFEGYNCTIFACRSWRQSVEIWI